MIAATDYLALLDTDPLAKTALIGLALTILVTLAIFAFMLTRRNTSKK